MNNEICQFPNSLQERFPDKALLRELGAQSYIGVPLRTPNGVLLGLMALLCNRPLSLPAYGPEVLRIAATQAGAEMARQLAEETRRSNDQHIEQLIYWDSITGLPNRRHFMERLQEACDQTQLQGKSLGLLYLDLHRFRHINDTQGHERGDLLLADIAGRFRAQAKPGEFVARLGGDEFMVLLTNTRPVAMAYAIERYRNSLSPPIQIADRSFSISASVGAALFPRDADNAQSLFQHASIALNHAKRDDSRTRFFNTNMADELHQKEFLQLRFIETLNQGGLALHYQPQFCLKSGKLSGAEALCRWHDEVLGHVSPGTFIPLAEEQGLIRQLGDWVLDEACNQLHTWDAQDKPFNGRLCVNVSAQQMDDPRLAEHVQRLATRVAPGRLGLELTESGLMRNPEQTVRITRALHDAGFGLAIDDFGTGYSSLTYLKRFAADTLKIDMSFVQDMLKSSHDHAIVATIIAMAETLGMHTVAEGVEEVEQAEALRALGCTGVQGFYYGRPVDGKTFADLWL
nr:bifunctional diguanylate cyclase/phosphodiesterase [Halomonas sp. DQ26W]